MGADKIIIVIIMIMKCQKYKESMNLKVKSRDPKCGSSNVTLRARVMSQVKETLGI